MTAMGDHARWAAEMRRKAHAISWDEALRRNRDELAQIEGADVCSWLILLEREEQIERRAGVSRQPRES